MATIDLGKIKQVFRGTYNNSTAYVPDDLVVFTDGSVTSTYICTTATTGNNPSSGGTAHGSWAFVAKGQATSPTTTQGDIIVRGASADTRLAIGAAGKVLKVNSSANGLEYGAGSPVLQCKVSYSASIVTVTHSGTADTNLFGLGGNRVYGDLNTITITPVSATSTMIIQGLSGMTDAGSGYHNSTGAFGVVAILNNSSTGAIDNTDFQFYPESSTLGNNFYPPNVAVQGSYASGNTSAQTWRMKGYTYRESGTNRSKFAKSHLIIWEVEI